jgi:CheY-like chemotaxis protein
MAPPASDRLIKVIGKIPLLKGLSPTQLRSIIGICEHRVLNDGELLCKTDSKAEEMYILVAGECGILGADSEIIQEFAPVSTIGDSSLLTGAAHPFTIKVSKPSHVFVLTKFQLDRTLRRDLDMQVKIYRNLSETLASSIGSEETLLEEYQKEKDQYEMRIASLERQLGNHSRKIDLVLELLGTRAEMSKDEVDLYLQERLKDLVPRILVVDDEPDFRRFAKQALDSFSVLEAQSGKEALQIVREEQFDLVIADIKMPEMDGYSLLANLRTYSPDLRVVAVSGYLGNDEVSKYEFNGFIDKPMGPERLQEVVEATLKQTYN